MIKLQSEVYELEKKLNKIRDKERELSLEYKDKMNKLQEIIDNKKQEELFKLKLNEQGDK